MKKRVILSICALSMSLGLTACSSDLGDTMAKAGLNTVMGISVVFFILILISLVIYCFKFIPIISDKLTNKGKIQKKEETKVVIKEADSAKADASTDDLELVAVIAAAIAASTGASTDSFVVRSIKKRY